MKGCKLKFSSKYFNVKDTLECGQTFRFVSYKQGYLIFSLDKCAYIYNQGDFAYIECLEQDKQYFSNYFDIERDYGAIVSRAKQSGFEVLSRSAELGKGIRILNQNSTEMLFSFIISQNNNIPRIKGIIEKLCKSLGEKKQFCGYEYYAFPTIDKLALKDQEFYSSLGLGYRAKYIKVLADQIKNGLCVDEYSLLQTTPLKQNLQTLLGVGPKVADCVCLFGFHRSDSFPVDTWIEKVYVQDFKGQIKQRNQIANWFVQKFGQDSGYFQQYLFYYKRSLQNNDN